LQRRRKWARIVGDLGVAEDIDAKSGRDVRIDVNRLVFMQAEFMNVLEFDDGPVVEGPLVADIELLRYRVAGSAGPLSGRLRPH